MTRQRRAQWDDARTTPDPPPQYYLQGYGQGPPQQPVQQAPPQQPPPRQPQLRQGAAGDQSTPAREENRRAGGSTGAGQPAQPPQGGPQQPRSMAGQGSPLEQRPDLIPIPPIDVFESNQEVTVFVDLPGCDEEDIRIRAENEQLTVVAERRDDVDEETTALRRERPTTFRRTVPIPTEADIEGANARYDAGVCTVTFPKAEHQQQREIGFQ